MSAVKVELTVGVAGASRIVLDGQDVSKAVSAFDLHADVNSVPTLVLTLPLLGKQSVASEMLVRVVEDAREVLVALGWTPPASEQASA